MKRQVLCLVCAVLLLLSGCRATPAPSPSPAPDPPRAEATFVKAVWIPYMEVEDWLASGDPTACRTAIAACMEDCRTRGVNTVYLHVRANSDAYYASDLFLPRPSVEVLLAQGFDPLAAAVEEAHARGLAIHAWVNPYRIGADVSYAVSEAVFEADGRFYYVPSSASVHKLIVQGVHELVDGYAIDGVQFDDYFYPEGAVAADAPAVFEQEGYTAYRDGGGALGVADWRRAKVSALVAAVYTVCHRREHCEFGISPAYDIAHNREQKYADVTAWIATAGFVDYVCPQLYFGFSHETAPFVTSFDRWDALPRDASVRIVAGLAAYKTGLFDDPYAGGGAAEWCGRTDILARQATLAREADWDGIALYSHRAFAADDDRDAAVVEEELSRLTATWESME